MRPIEQNSGGWLLRIGLPQPVSVFRMFHFRHVDAMLLLNQGQSMTMPGQQKTIGQKLEALDEISSAPIAQVSSHGCDHIRLDVACLQKFRDQFAGTAGHNQELVPFETHRPKNWKPGHRGYWSMKTQDDNP